MKYLFPLQGVVVQDLDDKNPATRWFPLLKDTEGMYALYHILEGQHSPERVSLQAETVISMDLQVGDANPNATEVVTALKLKNNLDGQSFSLEVTIGIRLGRSRSSWTVVESYQLCFKYYLKGRSVLLNKLRQAGPPVTTATLASSSSSQPAARSVPPQTQRYVQVPLTLKEKEALEALHELQNSHLPFRK